MYKRIIIISMLFLIPLLIINILFKIPSLYPLFIAEWSAGDVINYTITFMSFLGTIFLGLIATKQNNKLNEINEKLLLNQSRPILTVNSMSSEIDEIETYRTYDIKIEENDEGCIINNGWSLHQPHISQYKTLKIENIGTGPALNIKLYWYKLDSVNGLTDLNDIKNEYIDDFYNKIKYSNFSDTNNKTLKKNLGYYTKILN